MTEHSAEIALLVTCVLPGCDVLVAQAGEACGGCRSAFGPMLVETDRPGPTLVQISDRDRETAAAYAEQQRVRKATSEQPEVKSNQVCWLCEERRRCTRVAGQWECPDCRDVSTPPGVPG